MPGTCRAMRCRANWVLPVDGPPLSDGEVIVEGDRIAEVRPAQPAGSDVIVDFGDAILMPGLVNAHTHLDYTLMRGLLEDIEFFPWIRELTERKAVITWEDWVASATWGAAEAVAGGVTTLADCTDSGAALYGAIALGLRGIVYQEVFGIDESEPVEEIVADLRAKVASHRSAARGSLLTVGISPHAPYTVRAALFRALAAYAATEHLRLCIHAAESTAEGELLRLGRGPIAEMFVRRGIRWDAPCSGAVEYLDSVGMLTPQTLLVHGVQPCMSDRALIAERGTAWVHCPKSNAKLGVGVAPLAVLSGANGSAGRLGLGSDSVASNNTLDLFEEMRFAVLLQRAARQQIGALSAQQAVEMATIGSARALGMEAVVGSLAPGKYADLTAVRLGDFHSLPAYDPYNALVFAARASDVQWTLIGGEVRYDARLGERPEERTIGSDLAPARRGMQAAADKMRAWKRELAG